MPQKTHKSPRRRKGSRQLIDKMLAERQRMLVLMCEVMDLKPFTADKPVKDSLQEFASILVDYIASGHFSLYQRITDGTERRQDVLRAASIAYPTISESTDMAMEFNDKYGGEWNFHLLDHLGGDISQLGERLANRIDLEDRIIAAMLGEKPEQEQPVT
jgi:regulator of sigma D